MKGMKLMAAMCALVVMSASAGGLPLLGGGLSDTAISVNAVENVAMVDDTVYTDFNTALTNWTEGTTLTLLRDVSITSSIVFQVTKTLDLNGYTITNIGTGAVISFTGGTNYAEFTLLDSSGTNQGKITGGHGSYGGGIYVNQTKVFNMYGGTITGNTATHGGGGVFLDGRGYVRTFNMYGGVITGNSITGGRGENFYTDGASNFTMYGGTIDGGFVDNDNRYVKVTFDANGGTGTMSEQYVKKSTATKIKDNVNYENDGTKTEPALTREGYIFSGWNTQADGTGTNYMAGESSINISADTMLYAQWTEITATVTDGNVTTNFGSFSDAFSAWTDGTTLTLLKDVEPPSTIQISGTKKLDLNGHKMTTHSHFYIPSGSTIEICDNEGGGVIDAQYRVGSVFWINGGRLILNGGTVNGNVSTAGIVDIYANAEFTMNGGKITGRSTGRYDASVIHFSGSNGTFTMTGGEISGTTTRGGVTYFEKTDVSLNISGSAKIYNNKLESGTAQNLYLPDEFQINITGAMSDEASIGLTMQTSHVFTNSTNTAFNEPSKFFSDSEGYMIGKNADGQLLLGEPCTVTYQANGHGTAPTAVTVASGSVITEPTAPTASGWTFDGWYYGDTKFDFSTPITEDTTLTAKWLKNPTYTITIPADVNCSDRNSASAVVSAEYDVGELYTLSVAVASENNFQLKADYDDSVLIPYTIMCDDTQLSTEQTEILSVSGNGEQSKTLNFSVDPNQMYAGAYIDTLTFNISLT